jgi:hypothetical protein
MDGRYGFTDLVPCMRAGRLLWAGNAARMFGNKILKRNVEGSLGGRRPAGKSRNIWKDEVQNDAAKLLSAKNWRVAARYKSKGNEKQGRSWPGNGPKNHMKKVKMKVKVKVKMKMKKPNVYFLVYQILIVQRYTRSKVKSIDNRTCSGLIQGDCDLNSCSEYLGSN